MKESTVTIDQALKAARENIPGPVGEPGLKYHDRKMVWEVEVAPADNKIVRVPLDAQSGVIVSTEDKKPRK